MDLDFNKVMGLLYLENGFRFYRQTLLRTRQEDPQQNTNWMKISNKATFKNVWLESNILGF